MVTNGHVIHIMGQALKPWVCVLPKRSVQVKPWRRGRLGCVRRKEVGGGAAWLGDHKSSLKQG